MWRSNAESLQTIARRHMHKVDLCKVMVFSGQPEYWDRSASLRQNDYRQRFEQRECRASEKSDLLSGNNGRSALPEALDIFQGLSAGAKFAVLPFEHCCHPFAPVLWIADALLLVRCPIQQSWRTGIKALDFRKMIKEVCKKAGAVRDARKWKTLRMH